MNLASIKNSEKALKKNNKNWNSLEIVKNKENIYTLENTITIQSLSPEKLKGAPSMLCVDVAPSVSSVEVDETREDLVTPAWVSCRLVA